MKKFTLLFLVAAILAFSSFGVAAFAPENDSYTITYNVGAENAGSMYGMVAISGTGDSVSTTNTDDIVYIDQATADAEGNITFTAFAPMGAAPSDAAYVPSTVFIGGPSYTTVQKIGTLDAEAASTFAITGKVSDTVSNVAATVTVLNGEEEIAVAAAAADGTFSIAVAPGTYNVKFTKAGFCSFTYTNVVVGAADVALAAVDMTALAGDIAEGGNGEVKLPDLTALLGDYNHSGTAITNALADLDANGEVKLPDLTALLGGYNSANIVQAYAAE
ncbi:MAG: carboxypeptidase regulatory-like domain-containing protein [Clostridia bacterium]|nr:carboxypeptidase regulatory-like domain-containing protein [Clostridia bacterium]